MIAYFHIYSVGLMDKPSPVVTRRSAAGISDDASKRSASISPASGISSLSRLCGLCFGELHHRNKAEDPGCASGSPPSSTCLERLPVETTFPRCLKGQTSVENDAGRTQLPSLHEATNSTSRFMRRWSKTKRHQRGGR